MARCGNRFARFRGSLRLSRLVQDGTWLSKRRLRLHFFFCARETRSGIIGSSQHDGTTAHREEKRKTEPSRARRIGNLRCARRHERNRLTEACRSGPRSRSRRVEEREKSKKRAEGYIKSTRFQLCPFPSNLSLLPSRIPLSLPSSLFLFLRAQEHAARASQLVYTQFQRQNTSPVFRIFSLPHREHPPSIHPPSVHLHLHLHPPITTHPSIRTISIAIAITSSSIVFHLQPRSADTLGSEHRVAASPSSRLDLPKPPYDFTHIVALPSHLRTYVSDI